MSKGLDEDLRAEIAARCILKGEFRILREENGLPEGLSLKQNRKAQRKFATEFGYINERIKWQCQSLMSGVLPRRSVDETQGQINRITRRASRLDLDPPQTVFSASKRRLARG